MEVLVLCWGSIVDDLATTRELFRKLRRARLLFSLFKNHAMLLVRGNLR